MPIEVIIAAIFFVGLFTTWVILPSRLRKRHRLRKRDNLVSVIVPDATADLTDPPRDVI